VLDWPLFLFFFWLTQLVQKKYREKESIPEGSLDKREKRKKGDKSAREDSDANDELDNAAVPADEGKKKKKKKNKAKDDAARSAEQVDIPVPPADDEFIDPSLTNPNPSASVAAPERRPNDQEHGSLSPFSPTFAASVARDSLPTFFGGPSTTSASSPAAVSHQPHAPSPFDPAGFDLTANLPLFGVGDDADDETLLRAIQNVQVPSSSSRPATSSATKVRQGSCGKKIGREQID
jgi:hypothetical protein